jgi:hypothetical protein
MVMVMMVMTVVVMIPHRADVAWLHQPAGVPHKVDEVVKRFWHISGQHQADLARVGGGV